LDPIKSEKETVDVFSTNAGLGILNDFCSFLLEHPVIKINRKKMH
jgi:hypothetical protein